jgi:hypothetical protein
MSTFRQICPQLVHFAKHFYQFINITIICLLRPQPTSQLPYTIQTRYQCRVFHNRHTHYITFYTMEEPNRLPASSTNVQHDLPPQLSPSSSSTTTSVTTSPIEYPNAVHYSESRHDVSKPTQNANIPRSYANSLDQECSFGSNSNTVFDTNFNQAMAETWSAPTHAGTECDTIDECFMLITPQPTARPDSWPSAWSPFHAPIEDTLAEVTANSCSSLAFQPKSDLEAVEQGTTLLDLPHSENLCDRANSSTDSETLIGVGHNELLVDSWSEPTLLESVLEFEEATEDASGSLKDDTVDRAGRMYKRRPILLRASQTYRGALGHSYLSSHRANNPEYPRNQLNAANYEDPTIPWSKDHLEILGTYSSLKRFLVEDPGEAPFTTLTLRVSIK